MWDHFRLKCPKEAETMGNNRFGELLKKRFAHKKSGRIVYLGICLNANAERELEREQERRLL